MIHLRTPKLHIFLSALIITIDYIQMWRWSFPLMMLRDYKLRDNFKPRFVSSSEKGLIKGYA